MVTQLLAQGLQVFVLVGYLTVISYEASLMLRKYLPLLNLKDLHLLEIQPPLCQNQSAVAMIMIARQPTPTPRPIIKGRLSTVYFSLSELIWVALVLMVVRVVEVNIVGVLMN